MLFLFIYVFIRIRKNLTIWVIGKLTLMYFSNLFIPVLFIPMLETFIMVFNCKTNTSNVLVNYYFANLTCFTGVHVVHLLFSIIGIILILSYGYLFSGIYFETDPRSKNSKAR